MKYNFDEIIDRKNTNSLKYDFAAERGKPADILPLWVADMDFRTPPAVIKALEEASRYGIFGYSESKQDYFDTLKKWFLEHYDFSVKNEWLVKTPGIVFAICTAIRALTEIGDAVLIQQPVYYPFERSIRVNERKLVVNELLYQGGKYTIDFKDFEDKIVKNQVKLFVLCSPHNPVGRVWTKEELLRLGDICIKHKVIVIADEIHADFVYPGHTHTVFGSLKPEFLQNSIICTSPSKTFNCAGLQISNIFIENSSIRRKFTQEMKKTGFSQLSLMSIIACKAAYDSGGDWLDELKAYLAGNLEFVRTFLKEKLPEIRLVEPEGTYLIWLDCKNTGLSEKELNDIIVHKAGLWLDEGSMFGQGGEGFQRINIACPRSVLKTAMEKLEQAINSN